ncbi:MAG: chemotaxis protein CheW [Isosphaeraceae bacterium]|nr:chemotaxis protein CheW [Isosphaeraceae bacterium]
MDEFVKEYLVECLEGLALLEEQLLELEHDPKSQKILSSIFRVVHSIKGSSGFLGFPQMAAIAHEGEDLLGRLRDGRLDLNDRIVSGLLAMVDAMRSILGSIESGRGEGERDDAALIDRLHRLQTGYVETPEPPAISAALERIEPEATSSAPAPAAPPPPPPAPAAPPASVSPEHPASGSAVIPAATEAPEGAGASALADTTIRVDVGLLDKLMNLVGELVLARNQILRCSIVRDEALFQACSQRLNLITTELQEGMMKTRMQPIRNIFSKLPRVVRDLALTCGKQARLMIEGEETELDKTIIEAIKDPITHIVRNSVDHGIEAPKIRAERGKPEEGTLRMRAYHEGGMVNIEVSDDGGGIDPARIRRKAIERGWLSDEQAARWTDRELLNLIFRPGFSTADALTMVSGRGVGMDVVKNRVESIGGSVDLHSRLGEGTIIKMKIPLTLTIINALIVSAGGDRFAIPQVNLVELIRLEGEAIRQGLAAVHGAPVCRYRGRLLPLVDLNLVLGVGRREERVDVGERRVNIVVLQADELRFGLVVDRIDDAQEIVVRPLARQLKGIACFAGATIMGDGRIALILDAFGLAKALTVESAPTERRGILEGESSEATPKGDRGTFLLLRDRTEAQYAVPLEEVARLESFGTDSVEWVAARPVVQYRGTLLPLVDVAEWLAGRGGSDSIASDERGSMNVIIHESSGRRVGLVFDRVLDILDQDLDVRGEAGRPGVRFTAAVQGHATEILDLTEIARVVGVRS